MAIDSLFRSKKHISKRIPTGNGAVKKERSRLLLVTKMAIVLVIGVDIGEYS
jgi:hypothetical protein